MVGSRVASACRWILFSAKEQGEDEVHLAEGLRYARTPPMLEMRSSLIYHRG